MTNVVDHTLARLSEAAFLDAPGPLAGGFVPLTAGALGIAIDAPGEGFANGIYRQDNAAALVASGVLGGLDTLVLSFRGADDRQDSVSVLRDPAAEYARLADLVAAVDRAAASGAYDQVLVTGHSLGGSLTQIFMANHPEGSTPIRYAANTHGSPGALVPDAADPRIVNYVVVDDPAVFLGENRAGVGDALEANALLARAVADVAAGVLPGLTANDLLAVIPNLDANYENAGTNVDLPGKAGGTGRITSVAGLLQADPDQHDISLYVRLIGETAFRLPGSADLPLFDPGFYLRRNADVAASGLDPEAHYETYGWREGRDPNALFDTSSYLQGNADVAAAGIDPLAHYATYGWREGRDPNAFLDTGDYLAANPDVAAAGLDPLVHYVLYGWSEGRDPGPNFDPRAYLLGNPDVAAASINPLAHYLEFGIAEGRVIA